MGWLNLSYQEPSAEGELPCRPLWKEERRQQLMIITTSLRSIKVKDYISSKPLEVGSEAKATAPSSERKSEGSCGPARIEYA